MAIIKELQKVAPFEAHRYLHALPRGRPHLPEQQCGRARAARNCPWQEVTAVLPARPLRRHHAKLRLGQLIAPEGRGVLSRAAADAASASRSCWP